MARQAVRARVIRGAPSGIEVMETPATKDDPAFEQLSTRLADRLEQLSYELMREMERELDASLRGTRVAGDAGPSREVLQRRIRLLGQLAGGLADVAPEALPVQGAGFGSTVTVEDLDHGASEDYTLVTGSIIDFDAGQVSLASPIGQSLLGRRAGETISIQTPLRHRRLRIARVRTLHERLRPTRP